MPITPGSQRAPKNSQEHLTQSTRIFIMTRKLSKCPRNDFASIVHIVAMFYWLSKC